MPDFHVVSETVIRCSWVGWVVFWFVGAFRTKRTVYRQPWAQRLAFLFIVVGAFVWAKLARHPFVSLIAVTPLSDIAGTVVCVAGLGWSVWARIVLGRNWSGFVTLKEDHELIQSGPYRVTRHPIYTGILAAVFGSVLALQPTVFGIILSVGLAWAFMIKLRQEEALMVRQFPEAYAAYRARVKAALIPWVW